MRDLCAVVGILVRTVRHRWHHSSACRGVAAQLVRDEPTGAATLCLQQFPKDPDGGAPIPSRLDEDVEDFAVLVHGSPRVLSAPVARDEELVEVPGVAQATASLSESVRVGPSERLTPLADGLVSDGDAPLDEEVFHISQTQAEPKVESDWVAGFLRHTQVRCPAR